MSEKKNIDYSEKMPEYDFTYDHEYYPDDSLLPDPQLDPVIAGSKVPIQKVGIGSVDLPVQFIRRDGTNQVLHVKASLYSSVDSGAQKGLNLSRFYEVMHNSIESSMSIDSLKHILTEIAIKQESKHAYCKFRFAYPWIQEALRTRKVLSNTVSDGQVFKIVNGKRLSYEKAIGHIYYTCELEGQYHEGEYKYYLTVDYVYSSTCPCSFELANDARTKRGKAANAHSQKSIAHIKVQFDPANEIIYIEDIVELARRMIPTEVLVLVKRRDEQAFAELNGANLLFSEDAARLLYEGLNLWFNVERIKDFSVIVEHMESLHPWSAIAIIYKGVEGGLR